MSLSLFYYMPFYIKMAINAIMLIACDLLLRRRKALLTKKCYKLNNRNFIQYGRCSFYSYFHFGFILQFCNCKTMKNNKNREVWKSQNIHRTKLNIKLWNWTQMDKRAETNRHTERQTDIAQSRQIKGVKRECNYHF